MESKYKIIATVLSLLLLLSIGSSIINYQVSMNSTQEQLKTQSLPLSVDNIYTEIQKNIIQPYLVASMMSHDTFVLDWINEDESSVIKIQNYLDSIKNRYGMLVAFLVSDKTKNYYTQNGLIDTISHENDNNKWYFKFKDSQKKDEINIDYNGKLAEHLIMFINFKMFDQDFHYVGATGVGIQISYIDDMLKMFKSRYNLNVKFLDKDGNFVFLDKEANSFKQISKIPELHKHKNIILSKESRIIEYEKDGFTYLLHTKYIPEIDIHLLVEAKLDDFTQKTKKTFFMNLGASFFLTLVIAIVLIRIIGSYNKRLEQLATIDELTKLANRRNFNESFSNQIKYSKRLKKPLSLLFIDIDDFKNINDELGHNLGDEVLKTFARILQNNARETDLIARWGGEEFVIAFVDTSKETSLLLANKISEATQNSLTLHSLINRKLTVSIGITELKNDDSIDTIITRADNAMYISKTKGKNRVEFA